MNMAREESSTNYHSAYNHHGRVFPGAHTGNRGAAKTDPERCTATCVAEVGPGVVIALYTLYIDFTSQLSLQLPSNPPGSPFGVRYGYGPQHEALDHLGLWSGGLATCRFRLGAPLGCCRMVLA